MKIRHYGLACSSEETADRFYEKLLGLKKSDPKIITEAICRPLFGIPSEMTLINYGDDEVHFEIFIHHVPRPASKSPAHICLEVGNVKRLIERCKDMDIPVVRVPKGEQWITFIKDFDGNLFEIKSSGA